MEGGLPERKGTNKEVLPGGADRSGGHVGTTAPGGGASQRQERAGKGVSPSELPQSHTSTYCSFPMSWSCRQTPCPSSASTPCLQLSVPSHHQPPGTRVPGCKLLFTQRRAFTQSRSLMPRSC